MTTLSLDRFSRGKTYERFAPEKDEYADIIEYHAQVEKQLDRISNLLSEMEVVRSIANHDDRHFIYAEKKALKWKIKICKERLNELKKMIDAGGDE